MKVKVWVPFEIQISKPQLKKAMKEVRKRWTLEPSDPVHMEDVIDVLRGEGSIDLPTDEAGLGLKFDHEWNASFTEGEL